MRVHTVDGGSLRTTYVANIGGFGKVPTIDKGEPYAACSGKTF